MDRKCEEQGCCTCTQHGFSIPAGAALAVRQSYQQGPGPSDIPLLLTGSSCWGWNESNPKDLKRRCTPWVTSNICEAEPVSLAGQNQQWLQSHDKHSSSRISLTVHHSLHLQGSSAGTAEAFLSKEVKNDTAVLPVSPLVSHVCTELKSMQLHSR